MSSFNLNYLRSLMIGTRKMVKHALAHWVTHAMLWKNCMWCVCMCACVHVYMCECMSACMSQYAHEHNMVCLTHCNLNDSEYNSPQ